MPKVGDCIKYVENLGYHLFSRGRGRYVFVCDNKCRRPAHNHQMTWTLGEMRHAVKYGC